MFAVAIWGAYLIRTFNQSALGLVTFWTTRVGSAVLALHRARAAPLRPPRPADAHARTGCRPSRGSCPFRWTFYFPIETLVGDLSNEELLAGLGMQVFWIVVGIGVFSLVWRHAIRRYTAVGN